MSKKAPLISVVMPTYNASVFIEEAIESVLGQTFSDFEFIIIDDGSDDNTIEIIKSYNDQRIIILKNNHDFIGSLNLGMTKSKGKYITRMDSDDIMLPERLETQYKYMETNPLIDVSGTWMKAFGEREIIMKSAINDIGLKLQSIQQTPLYHPTVILKQNIITDFPNINGIYQVYNRNYIFAEDYKLWTTLLIREYKFANIPQALLLYRCSKSQVTAINRKEMVQCTFKIQNEYLEFVMEQIVEKDPAFYNFLNNVIELCNNKKINFDNLKQIIYSLYSEILVLN